MPHFQTEHEFLTTAKLRLTAFLHRHHYIDIFGTDIAEDADHNHNRHEHLDAMIAAATHANDYLYPHRPR